MATLENLDLVKAKLPQWQIPSERVAPPHSNRGVNCPRISIDALTLTFKIGTKLNRYQRFAFSWFTRAALYGKFGSIQLPDVVRKGDLRTLPKGRGGYQNKSVAYWRGKELVGKFWGGNQGTMMFELHGEFCRKVPAHMWLKLFNFARRSGARITRCDLAADFYQGELCVRCCHDVYTAAGADFLGLRFGGRLPAKRWIDGGINGSTLYIGARSSAREICIYEKARQLGFFDLPWTRAEVRFRRARSGLKKYEIPLEILHPDNWWAYWAGSADYLAKLAQVATELKVGGLDIEYKAFFDYLRDQAKHCHKQYGGLIGYLAERIGAVATCGLLGHSRWSGLEIYPEAADYTAKDLKSILGPLPAILDT